MKTDCYAIFDRDGRPISGYITDIPKNHTKSNKRIKFEGNDGKRYYPKQSEIHTIIPLGVSVV